jgi:hypothetical protein
VKSLALFLSLSVLLLASVTPALAQKPGTPGAGWSAPVSPGNTLVEPAPSGPPGTLAPVVRSDLGSIVKNGFLIILITRVNPLDPATWRDVVVFSNAVQAPDCGSFGYSGYMLMISSAVGETGISDGDLAQIPAAYTGRVTVAGLTSLFGTGCVSLLPNQPSGQNVYTAGAALYNIQTIPAQVTPAGTTSWGQLKLIYR